MTVGPWTAEQVRSLGVRTDLVTACAVRYGCGRTKAYELYRSGQLDFPALKVGARIVVPTAPILRLLFLSADSGEAGVATPASTPTTHGPGGRDAAIVSAPPPR